MAFKDWTESIKNRMKNGGFFGTPQDEELDAESNMANGGYSGYHPNQKKNIFGTQSMRLNQQETMAKGRSGMTNMFPPVEGSPFSQPPMMPYPAQEPQQPMQDPAAQYTQGFGGFQQTMQQPVQNQYPPMGAAPMQPPVQQPWPQQTMQQSMSQQFPPMGMTGMQQPQAPNPWPPQPAQQPQQQSGQRFTERIRALRKEAPQPQQESNISYMPGTFVGNDGKAYSHVERVAQLVSVSACFRIIEFMRNGESVIVNTESIANEADVQRCLDMLAGAAFTLGCSLTKITQLKRAYLIAPKTVLVMQDVAVANWSRRDQMPQQDNSSDEEYQSRFRPERGVYAPDRPYEPEQAMTYPQTAPAYNTPAAAPYQAPQQQSKPVVNTPAASAFYQATSRQQAAPAYNTPAASPYQATSRQYTTRTQPRESYNSDTRRGFYGTAAGGFGGFGQ